MFNGKKFNAIEERLANLEQFEKSVSTICDNYFAKNEKKDLSFSTGCTADKFYHFVMSVDEKLKRLGKIEEENKTLKAEVFAKTNENEALKFYLEDKNIINSQAKDIEQLRKTKTATAKGGNK